MTDTTPPTDGSEWLTGGNMNAVERIGDTVHRAAGPWTPTIHRLLDHLHEHGVGWLPRALGFDQAGREILSYLPGYVPAYPLPAWIWDDAVLTSAVERMAELHDATTAFATPDDVWQLPAHAPAEVVCHNDFAPYNMVFADDHTLTGVIDCDTASPGPRVWDLAYLAYRLVPLTAPDNTDTPPTPAVEKARRLRLVTDVYGHELTAEGIAETAARRLDDLAAFTAERVASNAELADHVALYRSDARWIRDNLTALSAGDAGVAGP